MKIDLSIENQWIEEAADKIHQKMSWVSDKNKNKIPYTTDKDGNYDDRSANNPAWGPDEGLSWWTNGFWGGMMWLLYQDTKEEKYAEYARISEEKLAECFDIYEGLHHDVGFMYMPTAVLDYRLSKNRHSRILGLHAANLLAGRFNPAGNFIRAWNDSDGTVDRRGWAIIDCMMNLSLLYWASGESNDPRFKHIAVRHADTVIKEFVRSDGSVHHIVEFNPETGTVVRTMGGQGYGEGSAWTRGQAWGIYGFVISYLHTGYQRYLKTAVKIADYCISRIPKNGLIPIDFDQPIEPPWEDSCGACIMASGLLELAKCISDGQGEPYLEAGLKILKTIYEMRSDFSGDSDGIVKNCSTAYHWGEKHIAMSYADYFFIEAICKLRTVGLFTW